MDFGNGAGIRSKKKLLASGGPIFFFFKRVIFCEKILPIFDCFQPWWKLNVISIASIRRSLEKTRIYNTSY